MTNPLAHELAADYRQLVVPGYETDPSAVGTNRTAVDPDGDRPWHEVHDLTEGDVAALIEEHG